MNAGPLTQKQKNLILVATILASGMAFLDGSIVNIALPSLQRDLGVSFVDMQWVINGYALSLAALLLLGGALGDRFGQRRVFTSGIFLFIAASLAASLARSIDVLVIARAVQGIGAAIMIPGSLAIINVSFPASERGRVIGLWAGVSGGMAAFGSFLGGLLIERFNWPSVFYINIPLGLIALVAAWMAVHDHEHKKRSLDIAGTLFITLGLLGLAYGLMQGTSDGWGNWHIVTSLAIGVIAIITFIMVEMRVHTPMVPFEIFRNGNVVGANVATFFLYGALASVFFLLALNMQQVQGLSASTTAIGLLPFPLIIMLFAGRGGQLADKVGPRMPMIVGPLFVALGMALLAVPGIAVPVWYFLPGIVAWGIGMCLIIAPLTKSAMSVDAELSGAASGVNNAVSRVAGLLFVAIFGALMLGLFGNHLQNNLSTNLDTSSRTQILDQKDKLAGIVIPDIFGEKDAASIKGDIDQSFLYAYRWIIFINVLCALLSSLVAFVTIRNK